MTLRTADYLPQKINQYVPNMSYAADVVMEGPVRVSLGAPVILDADGILDAESMAAAGSTTTFESAYSRSAMSKYGRCVQIAASSTAAKVVTITGRDYLGQPMSEGITLNAGTPVLGLKAFAWVEKVSWLDQAGITLDVGWADKLGLPYKAQALLHEMFDASGGGMIVVGNTGTFVAGAETDPQTISAADPRGTYLPLTDVPDGTKVWDLILATDRSNLHGVAHFLA